MLHSYRSVMKTFGLYAGIPLQGIIVLYDREYAIRDIDERPLPTPRRLLSRDEIFLVIEKREKFFDKDDHFKNQRSDGWLVLASNDLLVISDAILRRRCFKVL